MSRSPRYDILFEPVKIGPVTAPNRFYATPHAIGAGNQMPHTRAAMREVRAEGGWGVINTGYCSIHPSSDDAPLPYGRLWDDEDIKVHALMVEAVHRHGSLAGVELWHGGSVTGNRFTRMPTMSVSGVSYDSSYPGWINIARSRPMDKGDIREFRQWHVDAARRAKSISVHVAVDEQAHRRIWRQSRKSRAIDARDSRGHARCCWRLLRDRSEIQHGRINESAERYA
jgi:dimethylamine/trimethylamine dehydrogenase